MSNLKDTDIDDLFRRASDQYPLRTDSADWDKMAAALLKDPTPSLTDGEETGDGRRKRRFFWLLLLLPLAGAGYYAWHRTGSGLAHSGNVAVVTTGVNGAGQSPAAQAGISRRAGTNAGSPTGSSVKNSRGAERVAGTSEEQSTGTGKARVTGTGEKDVTGTGEARVTQTGEKDVMGTGEERVTGQTIGAERRLPEASNPEWAADMELERIARNFHLSVNVTAPPVVTGTPKPKAPAPRASYLYAGVFGAPDISTVKMQSVKGVGATFGFLLGYAFNGHWAVETGAYLDRKKYYTDGEYFNTKDVRMPVNSYLLNVNGTCNMWEIPLNIRYSFNPNGKTKWFATAGLSTYLMSSEKYNYAYKGWSGGNSWVADSAWNIRSPSQYPFSIVNLSAGFEQRLGRVGSLRVEPYVRLPLTGIGTGKLPIMSGGVNIGITRRLW